MLSIIVKVVLATLILSFLAITIVMSICKKKVLMLVFAFYSFLYAKIDNCSLLIRLASYRRGFKIAI